eukprot:RCo030323
MASTLTEKQQAIVELYNEAQRNGQEIGCMEVAKKVGCTHTYASRALLCLKKGLPLTQRKLGLRMSKAENEATRQKIAELSKQGVGTNDIARQLGIGETTVRRQLKELHRDGCGATGVDLSLLHKVTTFFSTTLRPQEPVEVDSLMAFSPERTTFHLSMVAMGSGGDDSHPCRCSVWARARPGERRVA